MKTTATEPVAPEIIPGLPPINDVITPMINAAYSPTTGLTPAINENAMASGTSATETNAPESTSFLMFCFE